MRAEAFVVCVGVVAICLGGCGGGEAQSEPFATSSLTPARPGVLRPFEALIIGAEGEVRAMALATDREIAQCMKERGFDYKPMESWTPSPDVRLEGDVEMAKKYGYGISEPFASQVKKLKEPRPAKDPSAGLTEEQAKSFEAALGGGDPDSSGNLQGGDVVVIQGSDGTTTSYHKNSCVAKANEKIEGDKAEWLKAEEAVSHLAGEAWDRIMADPAWTQANKAWSSCMAKKGYHYADPDAPSSDLVPRIQAANKAEAATWRKREVDTAVADAECMVSTGWLENQDRLVQKYEAQLTKEHEGEVMAFAEMRKKAIERATEINRAAG